MRFRVRSVKPDEFSSSLGKTLCIFDIETPLRTLSDPRRLPWGPFRTSKAPLGTISAPPGLPWGPFRAAKAPLGSPWGPRRLPWGPSRTLDTLRRDGRETAGRRQGDVRETARDLFWRPAPPRGRAPRPPSALLRNKEKSTPKLGFRNWEFWISIHRK